MYPTGWKSQARGPPSRPPRLPSQSPHKSQRVPNCWVRSSLIIALIVSFTAGLTGECLAQPPGVDLGLASDYVWRGITRATNPVVQPGVYVAAEGTEAHLAAGGWASIEPFSAGTGDLTDTGVDRKGVGEIDVWLEAAKTFDVLDVGVGWVGYFFRRDPGPGGRNHEHNANEIYGHLQFASLPLKPKLKAWYDIDYTKGAYLEGSLDLRVPLLPARLAALRSLHLTALAGWSAGQETNESNPSEGAHFAEAGLTHVDLSAWSSFVVAPDWSIAAEFHFQINDDPATKRSGAGFDSEKDTKVWFALFISWAHRFSSGTESSP